MFCSAIFPQKQFFSKPSEIDYCGRVDLLDSDQNQKDVHIAPHVSRVLSFSAQNGLECDFVETCFGFFRAFSCIRM